MSEAVVYRNPFPPADADRHALWTMLVQRDIHAYIQQDWDQVIDDFIAEEFIGVSGHFASNPDSWTLAFPVLNAYRDVWLEWAKQFADRNWACNIEQSLHDITNLRDIEIQGNVALLHKKFDGVLPVADGDDVDLNFQTLYRCRKVDGVWKIIGMTGFLPLPMGSPRARSTGAN